MEFYRKMPRPKKLTPDYRYHVSGQVVVTFNGTNFYLGPHDSPESKAKYRKLLCEYIASGFQTPSGQVHRKDHPITVADVTAETREWIKSKFANSAPQMNRFTKLCTTPVDSPALSPHRAARTDRRSSKANLSIRA